MNTVIVKGNKVFSEDGTRLCYTCRTNPAEYLYNRWFRCKECRTAYMSRQHKIRKYGITPEIFDQILASQGGTCAICHRTEDLVIDHDHATGKVRGILCRIHNVALGSLGDNAEGLEKVITYLKRGQDVI